MGLLQIDSIRDDTPKPKLLDISGAKHTGYFVTNDEAEEYKRGLILELSKLRNEVGNGKRSKMSSVARLNFIAGALALLNSQGIIDDDEYHRVERIINSINNQIKHQDAKSKLDLVRLAVK